MQGKSLRELRHKLGLTQNQLGELLAVSGRQVCRFEQGKGRIPLRTKKIALTFKRALKKNSDLPAEIRDLFSRDASFVQVLYWVLHSAMGETAVNSEPENAEKTVAVSGTG